ncbi:MAG: gamma-glutamyl-gamma-aminobutyrate hydrolase family protein [Halothiobacillaceae bacterium]
MAARGAPLIAVTGPRRGARLPRVLVSLALRWHGAQVRQIRPGDPVEQLEFDGVVITGGHDIDPVLYAAEPEVQPRHDVERDRFEMAVIDQALARAVPILGICRGAQLLNVRLGGSLFQDLKSRRRHTSNRRTILPLKTLHLAPDSQLEHLLGTDRIRINSLHNQAIDRRGDRLRIAGRDLDGIVQAVERDGGTFILGVQWHPEFLIYQERQRRLFRTLVEQATAQDSG